MNIIISDEAKKYIESKGNIIRIEYVGGGG